MIIKYKAYAKHVPPYITDGGYFYNENTEELIGVGTQPPDIPGQPDIEISQKDLHTYLLDLHDSVNLIKFNDELMSTPDAVITLRSMTEDEVIAMADEWYIANSG